MAYKIQESVGNGLYFTRTDTGLIEDRDRALAIARSLRSTGLSVRVVEIVRQGYQTHETPIEA